MKILEMKEKFFKKLDKEKLTVIDKIKTKKDIIKWFVICLTIYLLAFYPIARANFNYIDDMGRSTYGYIQWDYLSRFVSKYLAMFIHTSPYLADVSPLPQIIGIIFIVIASIITVYIFNDKKVSLLGILATIPIGLSPYYLECMSYKYDSPYMALSVLVSILPFLFFNKNKKGYISFAIANFLGVLVMCMTYQASSGVIPLFTIFLAFKLWSNKETKEALKLIGLSAGSYLLGLLFYKLFILVPVEGYVSVGLPPIEKIFSVFKHNIETYYGIINNTLRDLWKHIIMIIVICFVFNKTIESKQNKILAFIMSVIVVLLSAIVCFGVLSFLEYQIFAPRSIYGYGIALALISVNSITVKRNFINNIAVFLLFWCFFSFTFVYGNALAEQKRYESFRLQMIIDELNNMEMMSTDTMKTINLQGQIGRAPSIENLPGGYNSAVSALVPVTVQGGWNWGWFSLANSYKLKNCTIMTDYNEIEGLDTTIDKMYYTIKTNNTDYILIILK